MMLQSPRTTESRPDARQLQRLPEGGSPPYFHHGPVERLHARIIGKLFEKVHSRAAAMVIHVIISAASAAALTALLVLGSRHALAVQPVQEFEESMITRIAQWRTVALVDVAHEVSAMGGSVPAGIIIAAFAALLWLRRWRYSAVAIVITMAGGMFLNFLLKFPFDRPRPLAMVEDAQVHTTSYPSGHALVATICYGGIAWIAARLTREKKIRVSYYLTALFVITAICIGRIFLGTHFLSDMLAGLLAGIIWIGTILAGLGVLGVVRGRG